MAITLSESARNASADAVGNLLDGGTIRFNSSGSSEVATVNLGTPAFGAATSGTITANAITADNNVTGGTITKFEARASDSSVIFSGSVTQTGGGGDITLTDVTYGAGGRLEVTSLTYTQPA